MPNTSEPRAGARRQLDQSSLLSLLGYHVRRADVVLNQEFRQRISKRFKLRPVEFSVLSLITDNTNVTYKELGEALDVAAPNLALVISSMMKRKLVLRRPNPNDGRSMFLSASPKGLELLSEVRVAVGEMEEELLAAWKSPQRTLLLRMLGRVHHLGSN